MDLDFKIAPIFDHVAKFRGDRPRDRGDLTLNKKKKEKKRKKETAAKHNGRVCVITQRAALIKKINDNCVAPARQCNMELRAISNSEMTPAASGFYHLTLATMKMI